MKDAARILMDLVAIPSVSSLSNRPVIDYAIDHLKRGPWNIALYPYKDPAGVAKTNLVATTDGHDVELAFVCHTDTVPYDEAWAEAVHPSIRNGKLYGRGACDVKGFLACVLAAIGNARVERAKKPLAVVLTADEEVGCVGAKLLARENALRARYTIIGEPTGLAPVRAGKGYALAEITVRGAEAHSAFPSKGRSAIFDAARVVGGLERVARKLQRRKDRSFDPPFTTLNAGLIRGGTAKNIIAGECKITVEWRPIAGQDPRWAAELIGEELIALKRRFPGLDAKLDVLRMDPAFEPAKSRDLATLLESLSRRRASTVAFGTEAAHLAGLTSEAVVFGPGDMLTAHKTGEHVRIADLKRCVKTLTAVIVRLCG